MVHAVTVLALALAFAGIAGDIPLAALAAILIVVAYGIADVPELLRLLRSAPREDLGVLVTVVLDLTFAIALGIIASTVLLLRRMRDVHHIDSSGLITLQGIVEHRRRAGGRLVLTDVQPDVEPALRRFGIYEMLGEGGVYATTEDAITAIPERPWASVATAGEID